MYSCSLFLLCFCTNTSLQCWQQIKLLRIAIVLHSIQAAEMYLAIKCAGGLLVVDTINRLPIKVYCDHSSQMTLPVSYCDHVCLTTSATRQQWTMHMCMLITCPWFRYDNCKSHRDYLFLFALASIIDSCGCALIIEKKELVRINRDPKKPGHGISP